MSTSTDQQKIRKEGFVYILKSEIMPNIYKIGRTSRNPYERIEEISGSTGVPVSFELLCAAFVKDSYLVEQHMHDSLSKKRVSSSREFFNLASDKEAKRIFISMLSEKKELIETFGFEIEGNEDFREKILDDLRTLADRKKELESYEKNLKDQEGRIAEARQRQNWAIENQKKDEKNILYLYNTYKTDREKLFAYLKTEQNNIDQKILEKIKEIFRIKWF